MKSQQYHRMDGVFRNRLMCILLTIWIRSHTSVRQWVSFKRFMKNILLNYKLFGLIDEQKKIHQGGWQWEDHDDGDERAGARHGGGFAGRREEGDAGVQGGRRQSEEAPQQQFFRGS